VEIHWLIPDKVPSLCPPWTLPIFAFVLIHVFCLLKPNRGSRRNSAIGSSAHRLASFNVKYCKQCSSAHVQNLENLRETITFKI